MHKNKKISMVAAALVLVAIASAALAYWTAGGTGSGTASAGSDAGVSITNVAFVDDADADTSNALYPGSTVDVTFDVENDSPNTPVKVGKVKADTAVATNGVGVDSAHATAGCLASWFTYSGPTLNREIAAADTYSATAGNGGTLTMANAATNQNACKGATLTLNLIVDNAAI